MISKVKELKQFPEAKLRKIADCLEEESYEDGHCIFKQGQRHYRNYPEIIIYFQVLSGICSSLFDPAKFE